MRRGGSGRAEHRIARSTRSGGSSRPGSSPGWRGSCATSASPRTSRRTRSSPRSSSGRSRASRTTRAPGSWPPPSTARSTACAAAGCSSASTRSSAASSERAGARAPDLDAALDDDVGDDLLRLMFIACHPVLSHRGARRAHAAAARRADDRGDRARVPRPRADVAQRIVRAKRTLAEARVPFEVPARRRAAPRAWRRCSRSSTSSSTRATRRPPATTGCGPALCEDALRLGRILAGLAPDEPEVHGLVALMEIQASRAARARRRRRASRSCCSTRTARAGTSCSIRRGLAALERAERARRRARARTRCRPRSPPATPGRARADETDWARIAALYDALAQLAPSPVVELNRAVAVAMAFGPAAGLELVDALADEPALAGLPPAAERARRPAREARPLRRGARRVRARGRADPQRARADAAARARRRLRRVASRRAQ